MASYVDIANACGVLIGTSARVTSPDDNHTLPRIIRQVWDMNRRAVLRAGVWNFAMATLDLPALAGMPPTPWSSWFQMPADAVRLIEVLTDSARAAYKLEGGVILCNSAGPLSVRVLRDVTETARWDDLFADCMAKRLAWSIGRRIAGSNYSEAEGEQIYMKALATAKRVDAVEEPPMEQEESDWITARFEYGGG